MVRQVNARLLRKWLELLRVIGGKFEINQMLFAVDAALVADSEEKLGRLVSEFGGRVCETRKLRVNEGKSKVMRCSKCENAGHECETKWRNVGKSRLFLSTCDSKW